MDDQDHVMQLLGQMAEAWARGDGHAFAAVFSEDAQYVTAPGERLHGRPAIADSHQRIFDTFFKGTRLGRTYPVQLRRLAPDVFLVEATGSVLFPDESEAGVAPNGLMTMAIKRGTQGWQIVSFQNTPTGRARTVRMLGRYVRSRAFAFRQEWNKARKHTMEEKRKNMADWDHR